MDSDSSTTNHPSGDNYNSTNKNSTRNVGHAASPSTWSNFSIPTRNLSPQPSQTFVDLVRQNNPFNTTNAPRPPRRRRNPNTNSITADPYTAMSAMRRQKSRKIRQKLESAVEDNDMDLPAFLGLASKTKLSRAVAKVMQRKTDVTSAQRTRSLMRLPNWLEMRQIEDILNPKQPSPPEDVITPAMLEWHRTAPTGKVGLVVLPSRPRTQPRRAKRAAGPGQIGDRDGDSRGGGGGDATDIEDDATDVEDGGDATDVEDEEGDVTDVEDDAVDSSPLADGPHQNLNGVCGSTNGSGGGGSEHAGGSGCSSMASGASQPQFHELLTIAPSSNANHPNVPTHIAATQDHSDAGYAHEGHCNPPSHSTQASPTPLESVPNFNDTTSSLPALPTQVQSNDSYANTGLSNLQDPSDRASPLSQGSVNNANHTNSIYSALPAGTLSSGDYANPTHSGTPSHFHQASPPPYESIDPPPQNYSFLANPTNGHYESLFSVAPSSVSTAAARNYADHAGTDVSGMAVDDDVANMGSAGQVSTFEHEFSSGMQQSTFVSDPPQNSSFLNNTNHATFPYDQQPALSPFFGANQIAGDSAMDDVESCTPGLHSSQFQSFGMENVVDNYQNWNQGITVGVPAITPGYYNQAPVDTNNFTSCPSSYQSQGSFFAQRDAQAQQLPFFGQTLGQSQHSTVYPLVQPPYYSSCPPLSHSTSTSGSQSSYSGPPTPQEIPFLLQPQNPFFCPPPAPSFFSPSPSITDQSQHQYGNTSTVLPSYIPQTSSVPGPSVAPGALHTPQSLAPDPPLVPSGPSLTERLGASLSHSSPYFFSPPELTPQRQRSARAQMIERVANECDDMSVMASTDTTASTSTHAQVPFPSYSFTAEQAPTAPPQPAAPSVLEPAPVPSGWWESVRNVNAEAIRRRNPIRYLDADSAKIRLRRREPLVDVTRPRLFAGGGRRVFRRLPPTSAGSTERIRATGMEPQSLGSEEDLIARLAIERRAEAAGCFHTKKNASRVRHRRKRESQPDANQKHCSVKERKMYRNAAIQASETASLQQPMSSSSQLRKPHRKLPRRSNKSRLCPGINNLVESMSWLWTRA